MTTRDRPRLGTRIGDGETQYGPRALRDKPASDTVSTASKEPCINQHQLGLPVAVRFLLPVEVAGCESSARMRGLRLLPHERRQLAKGTQVNEPQYPDAGPSPQ